ncbi:cellulase [Stenotrophomonas sp.]|uniref:WD40/YVTN/BNR-like repeat-containing protein n=1 Tax=Stenotrophomonas sp. TaxID=69392 RepID=UPI0028A959B7|nr:cellulase [Stenotrophomonas sp.]
MTPAMYPLLLSLRVPAWRDRCRAGWLAGLMLVFPLLAPAAPTTTPYAWRNVAIGGGGFVTGLVFHPAERNLVYARTDVGGAYRWDAPAQRWTALTDWLGRDDANLTGIESLAVDARDPQRVYLAAGTYTQPQVGNGAILRSADRGATFERIDLPFKLGGNELSRGNGERLAVDPNEGAILLLGSRANGLWRSTDHGASWAQVDTFPAIARSEQASAPGWNGPQQIGIVFVHFDARSGQAGTPTPVIHAAVSTTGTSLYRSDDGGRHWQPVPGQPPGLRPTRMAQGSDGRLYIAYADLPGPDAMHNGALWRFDPAQSRWQDISPVPQSSDTQGDGFGWGGVSVDARDPDVVMASTFNRFGPHDDIFRSTDGGRSWRPVIAGAAFSHDNAPWTGQASPHWIADVQIDPFDPGHVLFVTGYGLWASRDIRAADRGTPVQWAFDNAGLEETVPLDLVSPAQGAHLLSALGDIDGFRHDDLQRSPRQYAGPRLTNSESIDVAAQAPLRVVRSGTVRHRRQGEVRAAWSEDGGVRWQAFASEPGDGEGAGRIRLSSDGGTVIWQTLHGSHWRTRDQGRRWQPVRGLPATAVVVADSANPLHWFGWDAPSGALLRSDDGGASFRAAAATRPTTMPRQPDVRADPQQPGVVLIGAGPQGLLRWSRDGGVERVGGVDEADSVGVGRAAPGRSGSSLFVSGRVNGSQGLFRSDDGGGQWLRIDDAAHRFGHIQRVTGDPRLHGRVYFATGGRGIIQGDPR